MPTLLLAQSSPAVSRRTLLLGLAGGLGSLAGVAAWQLHRPAAGAVPAIDAYRRGLTPVGWPVLQIEDTVLVSVAGRSFRFRPGPTAVVLTDFVKRFDATVERIRRGDLDDWSFARRTVAGTAAVWSEHAAGTALDLNALTHPRGRSDSFTARRRRALNRLLDRYDGVIGWGGAFANPDEMHFQIDVRPDSPALAALAAALQR
jgi:D-alanyl-D-alanine carboxypeptidase